MNHKWVGNRSMNIFFLGSIDPREDILCRLQSFPHPSWSHFISRNILIPSLGNFTKGAFLHFNNITKWPTWAALSVEGWTGNLYPTSDLICNSRITIWILKYHRGFMQDFCKLDGSRREANCKSTVIFEIIARRLVWAYPYATEVIPIQV